MAPIHSLPTGKDLLMKIITQGSPSALEVAEAVGMLLMGRHHLQFPNKQIHSSIVPPGWFQVPPAEPDFPPTFF
jgi:hypothetical protein